MYAMRLKRLITDAFVVAKRTAEIAVGVRTYARVNETLPVKYWYRARDGAHGHTRRR